LSPLYAAAVELFNAAPGLKVAVDIPTGVDPDTGLAAGAAVRADLTVTIGLPKPGFFHPPGSTLTGDLHVARIGFPPELTEDSALSFELALAHELAPLLAPRASTAHKGDQG